MARPLVGLLDKAAPTASRRLLSCFPLLTSTDPLPDQARSFRASVGEEEITRCSLSTASKAVLVQKFLKLYVPAIPLFCRILTTTRRFSACPSAVVSAATCLLVPIAPGASMFVNGIWPCCSRKFATFSARSVLSLWLRAALPTFEAYPFT